LTGLLVSSEVSAQTKAAAPPVSQHDKRLLGEPLTIEKIQVQVDTPKYAILPPVVVQGYGVRRCRGVMGGAVAGVAIQSSSSVLKDLVKDTLAFVGFPKKELTVYPNPASRGTMVKLSCPPDLLGECKLELFSANGALLQERLIVWSDKSQTELLNIPASLSAGVYFVKLSHPGTGKVVTRKLMVL
jgi:hypothetical protein